MPASSVTSAAEFLLRARGAPRRAGGPARRAAAPARCATPRRRPARARSPRRLPAAVDEAMRAITSPVIGERTPRPPATCEAAPVQPSEARMSRPLPARTARWCGMCCHDLPIIAVTAGTPDIANLSAASGGRACSMCHGRRPATAQEPHAHQPRALLTIGNLHYHRAQRNASSGKPALPTTSVRPTRSGTGAQCRPLFGLRADRRQGAQCRLGTRAVTIRSLQWGDNDDARDSRG